ncbi:sensor histidine kinase [uncultured Polaribacter sp.]|uniref:sensor histidine kinase n=1 Tax=uncultured Polaribacter sp. TaxID=174711 RepID=UPI002603709B|nr:sensor histidine kinase [uncultured Polaribacter sp.]
MIEDPILKSQIKPPFFDNEFNNDFHRPRKIRTNLRPPILLLLFYALSTCIKLVSEWYKSEKERTLVATQKINSELSFLKAQLNPHFLFNTLNSIYSLANKKSDNTTVAIVTLSELMRYMIYEAKEEFISLEKEIDYIKNYISLQLLRLKDSSGVKINIHGNLNYKIEPLLLISFIENAFKYGTDYRGKTDIRVVISINNNELELKVYNLSSLQNSTNKNSGIGLENIKNRLNLLYPNTHTLEIKNTKEAFEVNLKIKLKS